MSQTISTAFLPSTMEEKLSQIRRRQATISVVRAAVVGISVLLATMVLAMLIDWQFTLFNSSIRIVLTVTSLAATIIAVLFTLIPALAAALQRVHAAISADAEIPQLEERWQTVVTVAGSGRQPTSVIARAMLQQVTSEAVAIGHIVQPRRVADPAALKSAGKVLATCALLFVGFLSIDWPQTSVLLRRFCVPAANISATTLNCPLGDVAVARGESVDLVAEMSGLLRTSATLTIDRAESKPETIKLFADSKRTNSFVHRIQVNESIRYRVRAGDAETAWHTITAVDYPVLAEVRFTIVAPAYLHRPNVEKTVIPARLKVMQGSMLHMQMRSKEPLQRLELTIAPDTESPNAAPANPQVYAVTADADGWYRFQTQLNENLSLTTQIWNSHGLTNEDRSVCRIQVIADAAPVARVLTPTEEIAVAPDDVIDIKFEAHDDHGITKAELVVYDESQAEAGKPTPILKVVPIPLGDQNLAKHLMGTTQLDLKQLDLKPGTQISYAVRVTDNRAVEDARSKASPSAMTSDKSQSAASLSTPSKETESRREPSSDDSQPNAAGPDLANATNDHNENTSGAAPDITNDPSEKTAGASSSKAESKGSQKSTRNSAQAQDKSDLAAKTAGFDDPSDADPKAPTDADSKDADTPGSAQDGTSASDKSEKRAKTPAKNSRIDKKSDRADPSQSNDSAATNPNADAEKSPVTKSPSDPKSTASRPSVNDPANASHEDDLDKSAMDKAKAAGERSPVKQGKQPSADRPVNPDDPANVATEEVQPENPDSKSDQDKSAQTKNESNTDATANSAKKPNSDTDSNKDPDKEVGTGSNGGGPKSSPAEEGPPAPAVMAMPPQESESGQNAETNRGRLKITERLFALAEARESRKAETGNVRERVVEIDGLLSATETGLTQIVNREIPEDHHSAQYKSLDRQLGNVEDKISDLRKKTRDEQFAFVGLQMVDIGRSHITPARERVFAAIREPATASDGNSRAALQQIVRARELLAALLKRYDRVARDQQLAESLKDGVKMYEVYVEKMQQLMREARQNQNPLQRKMAVIEVGQDYLDRYAEVLTMRREMMAEFGRILGDDPRLLARYLDLVKRRRSSLRTQLAELATRQKETFTELEGWLAADATQREDLWNMAVELRLQASTQLAKDAAELGERIEKQFPLVLEATLPTPAKVIAVGRQIAATSRDISLEAKRQIRQPDASRDLRPKAELLVKLFVELDANLEQLNFENSKEAEVATYVTGRLLESRTVADQAISWKQTTQYCHQKQYYGLIEVDQHRLAIATELLRVDMQGIETELSAQFQQLVESSIPQTIVEQIRELNELMQEISFEQIGSEFVMIGDRLPEAGKLLKRATENFARAEELFDQMRRDIAAALDELKVPNPNVAELEDPKLDEFLTQLEREPDIDAQLGIPERPRNLRVIADSMHWQEEGAALLGSSEEQARGRLDEEKKDRKPEDGVNANPDEKSAAEMTEEEREEREAARKADEELAQALAALKEKAKDPATNPDELKKLEEKAKERQERRDQRKKDKASEKLWKQMETDLEKTLAALKKLSEDPAAVPVDRQRIDQLTKDLQRVLDQMRNERNADNRWKLVTEFERKKQILNAVARGERIPDEQWNKLLSTLDDGLWQVGARTLPEEYRKAIEQYQERIRKLTIHETDGE